MKVENKAQDREVTIGLCGVAAMLHLDGGDGAAVHGLLRCTDGSRGECEKVWCFQRGVGVVL